MQRNREKEEAEVREGDAPALSPWGRGGDSSGNGGSTSALVPEATENKTLIPLKGTFTGDTSRDTSQPHPWGMCPEFFHP